MFSNKLFMPPPICSGEHFSATGATNRRAYDVGAVTGHDSTMD